MEITIYECGGNVWAEHDDGPDADARHIGDFMDTNSAWHYCRDEYPVKDIKIVRCDAH